MRRWALGVGEAAPTAHRFSRVLAFVPFKARRARQDVEGCSRWAAKGTRTTQRLTSDDFGPLEILVWMDVTGRYGEVQSHGQQDQIGARPHCCHENAITSRGGSELVQKAATIAKRVVHDVLYVTSRRWQAGVSYLAARLLFRRFPERWPHAFLALPRGLTVVC